MKMVTPGGVTIQLPDCPQISLSPTSAEPLRGLPLLAALAGPSAAARSDVDDALFGGLGPRVGGGNVQHVEIF